MLAVVLVGQAHDTRPPLVRLFLSVLAMAVLVFVVAFSISTRHWR